MIPYDDFVELVRRMRAAQIEYFRTRSMETLSRAKALELKVDAVVRSYQTHNEMSLFEEAL